MKRGAKQNLKTKQATKHETQSKQQKAAVTKNAKKEKTQNVKANKDQSLLGETSYKRHQNDFLQSSAAKGNHFDKLSMFTNSERNAKDSNRNAATSISKSGLSCFKPSAKKPITDLSNFLMLNNENQDSSNIQVQGTVSPINFSKTDEAKSDNKSRDHSPTPNKLFSSNDFLRSPKIQLEQEQQMVLRSGNSASSSGKQGNHGSSKLSCSSNEASNKSLKQQKANLVESQFSSPSSQVVFFNDSLIPENTNFNLNSTTKNNTIRKDRLFGDKSRDKSPSAHQITTALQDYKLKYNDISEALNNISAVHEDFSVGTSPAAKGQDQQIISLLNQTLAESTGLNSHDFSMVQQSPQSRGSIENKIQSLLNAIMIEGQALWQVEWSENAGKSEKISFECESELLQDYPEEFPKLREQYNFDKAQSF